jgi:putative ABC transport system permease protein
MTAVRLFLGRIRTELVPAALLAVVVMATAFVAAAAPILFNRAADEGLRHRVAEAESVERNVQLGQITFTDLAPAPDDGMEQARQVGERLEAELPGSLRRILADDTFFAESIGWRIPESDLARPRFVDIRFQGGVEQYIELVDGRMPTGSIERVAPSEAPPGHPDFEAAVFEVALSRATADELGVAVGDRLELFPDPEDPLVGQFGSPEPAVIEVVGIYEVTDPQANVWFNDPALHQPTLVPVGINTVLVHATALASPDAFPTLLEYVFPARYTWRYYVDPQAMDASTLEQLVIDLRRMEGTYASFQSTPGDVTTLQTGLLQLTDRFLAERRSAESILVTAAIGPIAIALAAVGVLAILAMTRRRRSLILLRGRGGSVPQIVGSHLVEGLLLSVPPAALGAFLATQVIDARPSPWSFPAASQRPGRASFRARRSPLPGTTTDSGEHR